MKPLSTFAACAVAGVFQISTPTSSAAQGILNGADAASACEALTWSRSAQVNVLSDQDFERMSICAGMIRGVNTMLRNNCITPRRGSVYAMEPEKLRRRAREGDVEVLAPVFLEFITRPENSKWRSQPGSIAMAKAFQTWPLCRR